MLRHRFTVHLDADASALPRSLGLLAGLGLVPRRVDAALDAAAILTLQLEVDTTALMAEAVERKLSALVAVLSVRRAVPIDVTAVATEGDGGRVSSSPGGAAGRRATVDAVSLPDPSP